MNTSAMTPIIAAELSTENDSNVFSKDAFPRLGNRTKITVMKKRPSYSEAVQSDTTGNFPNCPDRSQTTIVRYNRARQRNIDFNSFVPRHVNTANTGANVANVANAANTGANVANVANAANVANVANTGANITNSDNSSHITDSLIKSDQIKSDNRLSSDLMSFESIRASRISPTFKIDNQHSAMASFDRMTPRKYRPKQSPKVRNSVGIALFRRRDKRIQILLVRKRSTYAFHTFVHSQYRSDDAHAIMELFNKMTAEEKLDILSLNFNQLWYRIWLNTPCRTAFYYMCKHKFENTFLRDGGKRLRAMIARSTCGELIWEIPKGRRGRGESTLDCAIREFHEETNISKDQYRVIFMPDRGNGPTRSFTHQDEGTIYTNTYYMAAQRAEIKPTIDFRNESQIVEIGELRWMDLDDVGKVDHCGLLVSFIQPLMRYMRKHV